MRGVVLAVALSACSFFAVTPAADMPQPAGDCTESFVAPGIDLLGAIAGGAAAVLGFYMISQSGSGSCHQDCGALGGAGVIIGLPGLIAAVSYGASTTYGHRRVDDCRRRHEKEKRQPPNPIGP
jgi:hypothetical protein